MSRKSSILSLIAAGTLTAAVVVTSQAIGAAGPAGDSPAATVAGAEHPPAAADQHWVNSWVSMPQLTEPSNMPPPPFTGTNLVFANSTLRQTVRLTVGGQVMRLRLSNAFGGAALPITAVSVALPAGGRAGVSAIQPGTSRPVTFSGRASFVIPVGAQMVSDPLDVPVAARSNLSVTIYLAAGQASTNITSHPGSRTTSYMLAGNHVDDEDLTGAASTNHWYFLSGVEVLASRRTAAVAILGDSLTDGRGSTTNENNRWPDQLLDRLQANPSTANIAILNQAAGGNRVLNDGLGPNALGRMDRDVLAQSGVQWLIVFEGVNDLGGTATAAGARRTAEDIIAAYDQFIERAHAHDIRAYGATLLPFGGNGYDDPAGNHEAARQIVNEWIRTSNRFDGVIDFDLAVRDPANPRRLLPAADDGDHLHLNPLGYRMLADAVPAQLFR